MRRLGTVLTVLVVLVGALPGFGQGDPRVPVARREGRVVVYGTMPADNFEVLAKIYEGRYGVPVEYWRAPPDRLVDRALAESRAGRALFDVVIAPSPVMRILKQQGIFAPYTSPAYEPFPAASQDRDGVLSPPYRLNLYTALYNPRLVRASEAPRTYGDLLDPRWRGRLVLADPTLNLGSAQWLPNLRRVLRAEWRGFVERLAAQAGGLEESILTIPSKVVAGEHALGIALLSYVHLFGRQGAPIDYVRLDPMLAEAHHAAVGTRAPHPQAARLFVDTLMSRAALLALAQAGEFVLLPGIYPPIRDADRLRVTVMEDYDEETYRRAREEWAPLFRRR